MTSKSLVQRRNPLTLRSDEPVGLASERGSTQLSLADIRTDGGTQMRAGLDEETVGEYLEVIENSRPEGDRPGAGWPFPPVVVFHDGETYWMGDGFHRVEAARRYVAQEKVDFAIPADVRSGTRREAILHAAGANASHGLRRTNADKRRAVEVLLADQEWGQWSNREIARRCKVDEKIVRNVRDDLTADSPQLQQAVHTAAKPQYERTFVHPKTGKPTTMKVAGQQEAGQRRRTQRSDTQTTPEERHPEDSRPVPGKSAPTALELPNGWELKPAPAGGWYAEMLRGGVATARHATIEQAIAAVHESNVSKVDRDYWWRLSCLRTMPAHDVNFKGALENATPELLREALIGLGPEGAPAGHKTRIERIEARLRRLDSAGQDQTAQQVAEASIHANGAITHDEAAAPQSAPSALADEADFVVAEPIGVAGLLKLYRMVATTAPEYAKLTAQHTQALMLKRQIVLMIAELEKKQV